MLGLLWNVLEQAPQRSNSTGVFQVLVIGVDHLCVLKVPRSTRQVAPIFYLRDKMSCEYRPLTMLGSK